MRQAINTARFMAHDLPRRRGREHRSKPGKRDGIEESCGHCTPCRVGLVLLKKAVHKVVSGAGEPADLDYMRRLANVIIQTSRCGLGQAAPNPVVGALQNFHAYADLVGERKSGLLSTFDLSKAVVDSELRAGRMSRYV